ncbi:hypothetical protein AB4Z54_68145 [Streptomyces sp. MCAF7]
MRIRHALATTAVGTALALGVSVAPAFAASSDATTAADVRVLQSDPDCYYQGHDPYPPETCTG